jgi:hypothetical protein
MIRSAPVADVWRAVAFSTLRSRGNAVNAFKAHLPTTIGALLPAGASQGETEGHRNRP